MSQDREAALRREAAALAFDLSAMAKPGGNYAPYTVDGRTVQVSGQVARAGAGDIVTGRAGRDASLADAKRAAALAAMRALVLLRHAAGGDLARIAAVTRMTVFTRCTEDFTQLSEVSDGASDLLHAVLGEEGTHARSSIGVFSLPKGALAEVELSAVLRG